MYRLNKNKFLILLFLFLAPIHHVYSSEPYSCNNERFKYAKGLIDSYRGDTSKLKIAYSEISGLLKMTPNCVLAYRELARIAMKSGHISGERFRPGALEFAKAQLEKAIEIDDKYSDAYVLLSSVYIYMSNYKEAKSAAEKALNLGSNNPWLFMRMAKIQLHEGNLEDAEGYYLKIINSSNRSDYEVNRATTGAMEGLIEIYKNRGKLEKADNLYNEVILRDKSAWSHGNYANFLLYYKGDYNKAIKESEYALSIMDYGIGRYMLSASLYRKWAEVAIVQNNIEEAQQYFNRAYKIYPDLLEIKNDAEKSKAAKITSAAIDKYAEIAINNYNNLKSSKQ